MFAVYRVESDGCTYSSDTVLFVTENEQTARDAVTLAELEKTEALAIPGPTWSLQDVKTYGNDYPRKLIEDYSLKVFTIFTIDIPDGITYSLHVDNETSYYYQKVEVR